MITIEYVSEDPYIYGNPVQKTIPSAVSIAHVTVKVSFPAASVAEVKSRLLQHILQELERKGEPDLI